MYDTWLFYSAFLTQTWHVLTILIVKETIVVKENLWQTAWIQTHSNAFNSTYSVAKLSSKESKKNRKRNNDKTW